jgi:hypothetical protein
MHLHLVSDIVKHGEPTQDPIIAVSQFFIHPNPARQNEINWCLFANVINQEISRIILLNEREYSMEEMGLKQFSHKIEQVIIGKRLTYAETIRQVHALGLRGYIVLHNSDIFFDETLGHILVTDSSVKPTLYAQLRFEFKDFKDIKIFGPRTDSQDAWIWHSNFNDVLLRNAKVFNFQLGKPGCDNALVYLFKIFGFRIVNDPQFIHIFHYHTTEIRNYSDADRIKDPYGSVFPVGCEGNFKPDCTLEDVDILHDYIISKGDLPYLIPRPGAIESIVSHSPETATDAQIKTMKNNAGINLTSVKSAKRWAKEYMTAFHNCEIFAGWDKNGQDRMYRYISKQQDHLDCLGKKRIWAHCFDVFEQIERRPWTLALKGKRLLIVSQLEESIREQLNKPHVYGIDLFPECTFVYLKPPQTAGEEMSLEWSEELEIFYRKLQKIKDEYDVALVSAGGYGNIICNKIFSFKKQAIYVGGVLQMLFGILGNRWLVERGHTTGLYLNEHWTRPKLCERPAGCEKIENKCYW